MLEKTVEIISEYADFITFLLSNDSRRNKGAGDLRQGRKETSKRQENCMIATVV